MKMKPLLRDTDPAGTACGQLTNDGRMELFEPKADPKHNLLPYNGVVNYHGRIMEQEAANAYYEALLHTVPWKEDQAVIFGKLITTRRKVAWYGDEHYTYTYSKITRAALKWTPELLQLKAIAERQTQERFNSCLLNLYHNGGEGMAWHSDSEKDLKRNGAIASMSFGAKRKFMLRHKRTGEKTEVWLDHGSLLVMKGETQSHWLHSLPKSAKIISPRINLTFRIIV